jgi:type VI secretion system protein ImpH
MSLSFPSSALKGVRPGEREGDNAEMEITFLGLAGVLGPLPYAFTEELYSRERESDYALRDFLDIFNHRLASILHRIHHASRLRLQGAPVTEQGIAQMLFSLAGLGTDGLRSRLRSSAEREPLEPGEVHDSTLLYYSGLLSRRPPTVSGLQVMLSDYFATTVEVKPLVGCWYPLDSDIVTKLGQQSCRLGVDAVCGDRFWDQQGGFELIIGPLPLAKAREFLPGMPAHKAIVRLTDLYVTGAFDYTLIVNIEDDDIDGMTLTDGQVSSGMPALGWDTWLGGHKRGAHPPRLVITPEREAEHPVVDERDDYFIRSSD